MDDQTRTHQHRDDSSIDADRALVPDEPVSDELVPDELVPDELLVNELLVEEISIDGMCGVY